MRKAALVVVTLLLAAGWVFAQQQKELPSQQSSGPISQTQRGCLQGSPGHYILITSSGMTLQVVGSSSLLRRHLGQEVQIQGEVSNPTTESVGNAKLSGGGTASAASEPVLQVDHLSKIADTCSAP